MGQDVARMKVVGRRRLGSGWDDVARLLRTAAALRPEDAVAPRGVWRFRTFEEADAWMTQAMARRARRSSKTSSGSAAR